MCPNDPMQSECSGPLKRKAKILVIGAGPAGLTAALQLARDGGFEVTVTEADAVPGGMARSFLLWNRRVDLGPHRFFSANRRVNALWLAMTRGRHHTVQRKTSILFGRRTLPYPLTLSGVWAALSIPDLLRAALSYLLRRGHPVRPARSFSDVIRNRFGDHLYRIFFESYTEKVWGFPCADLDKDFALQRISSFSFAAAVRGFFPGRRKFHKTLLTHFVYPENGAGTVYETMAEELQAAGGRILYRAPVERLNFSGADFVSVQLADGRVLEADYCISTMPLHRLLQGSFGPEEELRRTLAEKLKFRNTLLVYLRLTGADLFSEQWIYVNERNLHIGRITNFNNWGGAAHADTVLCLELWCHPEDELWRRSDEQIAALALEEFRSLERFARVEILDSRVVRVPHSYPVYLRGYREVLGEIETLLSRHRNLLCIGRAGAYRYNNQDHSILMGLLAYENIARGAGHNIWRENLDDVYFEAATLHDSGLAVPAGRAHA